jgi:hypothetical protein
LPPKEAGVAAPRLPERMKARLVRFKPENGTEIPTEVLFLSELEVVRDSGTGAPLLRYCAEDREHYLRLGTIEEVGESAVRVTSVAGSVLILSLMTWEDWKRNVQPRVYQADRLESRIRNLSDLQAFFGLPRC